MRTTHRSCQGKLPSLTATATAAPYLKVVADQVDVLQGLKDVAGQNDVTQHIAYLTVDDFVGIRGAEGELLRRRLTPKSRTSVDAVVYVFEHLLEGRRAVTDVGIAHAHDGFESVGDGSGVSRWVGPHARRGFAAVEEAVQDTVFDQVGVPAGGTFIVVPKV